MIKNWFERACLNVKEICPKYVLDAKIQFRNTDGSRSNLISDHVQITSYNNSSSEDAFPHWNILPYVNNSNSKRITSESARCSNTRLEIVQPAVGSECWFDGGVIRTRSNMRLDLDQKIIAKLYFGIYLIEIKII